MTGADTSWREAVQAVLKGAPFEDLITHTVEDLAIQPLYDRGSAPSNASDAERAGGGWDVRAPVSHPDPVQANHQALAALQDGANSILLRIDPSGRGGCAIGSEAALARVLDGIVLEGAAVALDAGFGGTHAASWLADAAKGSPAAKLELHLDPLSAFAGAGFSPGPIEAHLKAAAHMAAELAEPFPAASLFLATGRTVHEAGGSTAQELGMMAASAAAYARALTSAGLGVSEALGGISLGVCVDGDVLQSIAKARAARRIWARIASACGASCPARIEARSSRRMLTAMDAWTNLIRLTVAGFAAAAGGADAIVLDPYTDAIGPPTPQAMRLSRNIQLILMQEAHLDAVQDPGAGAFALEALTDELAREGWGVFQAIETEGGAAEALTSGFVASNVEAMRMARAAAVGDGKTPVLGVSLYPDPDPAPVDVEEVKARACEAPDVRLEGEDSHCPALVPTRIAEIAEVTSAEVEA
jgi:methylmalonyl-CoA mutase